MRSTEHGKPFVYRDDKLQNENKNHNNLVITQQPFLQKSNPSLLFQNTNRAIKLNLHIQARKSLPNLIEKLQTISKAHITYLSTINFI